MQGYLPLKVRWQGATSSHRYLYVGAASVPALAPSSSLPKCLPAPRGWCLSPSPSQLGQGYRLLQLPQLLLQLAQLLGQLVLGVLL